MPLVVNTNVSSLIAQRNLGVNTKNLNKSYERLASGYRINHAGDDSAGLAISENLMTKVRGIKTAQQNAQDGVSILQIAEGALSTMADSLQRVRELTVQAANDTNSTEQRDAIEREIVQRLREINRLASATNFNGKQLLDGTTGSMRLQIGADANLSKDTLYIASALATTTATAIGVLGSSSTFGSVGSINFSTGSIARQFITDVDTALTEINKRRALIGAFQNQLESVMTNQDLSLENFNASLSRVRDLDVAAEMSNLTRNQILQQSSLSILSQANQSTQQVLSLLQR